MTNFIIFTAVFHNDIPIKPLFMGNFGLHFIYFFNWTIITLQCSVGLCCTMQISHNYIYNYFFNLKRNIYIYISPTHHPEPPSLWTPAIVNISASSISPMNTWLWPHILGLKTQRIWFWSPPCFSLTHPTNTQTRINLFFRIVQYNGNSQFFFYPIHMMDKVHIQHILHNQPKLMCKFSSLSAAPSLSLWLGRANQNLKKYINKLYLL